MRSASPFLNEETRVYLRDTDDHMAQTVGRLDFCREVAMGLMDLHLSTMGHRQNEIMKVLTLMASIFASSWQRAGSPGRTRLRLLPGWSSRRTILPRSLRR